jgi:tRNA pseudouridine38-40 synthase
LRYFFHIEYNGHGYQGWQRMPQARSVQAVIESQLKKILKADVGIVGCGRTDTRVHASQFFFHLDIAEAWDYDLVFRVNKNLPADIALFSIHPMEGQPNARLDAVARTYNYFIHTYKDPYLTTTSSYYALRNLRLDEMKKAASLLPNHNDYRGFCRQVSMQRTTFCYVTKSNLYVDEPGDNIRFEISANRFLNGMIRIIMKRLLLIGNGKMSVDEFQSLLFAETTADITGAYPQGLYLSRVTYPFLDIPCRSELFNQFVRVGRWKSL